MVVDDRGSILRAMRPHMLRARRDKAAARRYFE
jgi:hypothetical protein